MVIWKTSPSFSYHSAVSHECHFLFLGYQQEFIEVTGMLLSPHLLEDIMAALLEEEDGILSDPALLLAILNKWLVYALCTMDAY